MSSPYAVLATDNRTTVAGDRPDPNETASDPVELRIVAAPPQRGAVEDGDGLQPKDEQPAIDQNKTANSKTPDPPAKNSSAPDNPPNEPKKQESKTDSAEESGEKGEDRSGEGQSGEGQVRRRPVRRRPVG